MTTTKKRKHLTHLAILGLGFVFSRSLLFAPDYSQGPANTPKSADVTTIVNDVQGILNANQGTTENWMSFGFLF